MGAQPLEFAEKGFRRLAPNFGTTVAEPLHSRGSVVPSSVPAFTFEPLTCERARFGGDGASQVDHDDDWAYADVGRVRQFRRWGGGKAKRRVDVACRLKPRWQGGAAQEKAEQLRRAARGHVALSDDPDLALPVRGWAPLFGRNIWSAHATKTLSARIWVSMNTTLMAFVGCGVVAFTGLVPTLQAQITGTLDFVYGNTPPTQP